MVNPQHLMNEKTIFVIGNYDEAMFDESFGYFPVNLQNWESSKLNILCTRRYFLTLLIFCTQLNLYLIDLSIGLLDFSFDKIIYLYSHPP